MSQNPFSVFEAWFSEAKAKNDPLFDVMALATASKSGRPSCRIVLFKELSKEGIVFFTNYESRKGSELESNPFAALTFFWPTLERQVRFEGPVQKITRKETEDYFKTRPRESQIGAWASQQSKVIEGREVLENSVEELNKKFQGREVPCPTYWGGFRLLADQIEFWTAKPGRLHDRLVYKREKSHWKTQQLSP